MDAALLPTALFIGLIVSMFQAATRINEMILSFISKLTGLFASSSTDRR